MKRVFAFLLIPFISLSLASCSKAESRSESEVVPGKIAFYSLRNKEDGWSSYLLKDGQITLIGRQKSDPAFSPDGKRIAVATLDDGIHIVNEKGDVLEKIPTVSSVPTRLGPNNLAWAPDGSYLLYSIYSLKLNQMYLVKYDFVGKKSEVIVDLGEGAIIISVGISPDSKRVIFFEGDDNRVTTGLYICNSNGSDLKRLAKQGVSEMWFSDSVHIAYCTNRNEDGGVINKKWGAIFRMNVNTGEIQKLRDMDYPILMSPIRLTKDDKYFYFPKSVQGGGLQLVAWPLGDPSREIELTKSFKIDGQDEYSQDRLPDWYIS